MSSCGYHPEHHVAPDTYTFRTRAAAHPMYDRITVDVRTTNATIRGRAHRVKPLVAALARAESGQAYR